MKTDARVRYTKMRIREAFFQCLAEKPVNRITVKELCELAEINRATFYTHYKDAFDLMEQLEEETLAGLRRFIENHSRTEGDMLRAIIEEMRSPRGFHALLASANGDPGFAAKIGDLFRQSFLSEVTERLPGASAEERAAAYRFLAGGCGNLLTAWIRSGDTENVEAMATRIDALCAAFLDAYGKTITN